MRFIVAVGIPILGVMGGLEIDRLSAEEAASDGGAAGWISGADYVGGLAPRPVSMHFLPRDALACAAA